MKKELATNSLERGFAVMKAIGQQRGGMTHAELSRALDIPKSTCTYILRRLGREGFVTLDEVTSRYKVGLSTLRLAHDALREVELLSAAEPVLYQLSHITGFVAILGARVGNRVLALYRVESPEFVHDCALKARSASYPSRERHGVGDEYSLTASAIGKVILAYLSPDELSHVLRPDSEDPWTDTVPDRDLLLDLRNTHEGGYAISYQQSLADALTLAAPIFDARGGVNASVCITQNGHAAASPDLARLIKLITGAGRDISRRLTGKPAGVPAVRPAIAAAGIGPQARMAKLFPAAKPTIQTLPVRSRFG